MGFKHIWYTWNSIGPSHLSHMDMGFHWTVPSIPHVTGGEDEYVGFKCEWYTWDPFGQSHLSHMGQ